MKRWWSELEDRALVRGDSLSTILVPQFSLSSSCHNPLFLWRGNEACWRRKCHQTQSVVEYLRWLEVVLRHPESWSSWRRSFLVYCLCVFEACWTRRDRTFGRWWIYRRGIESSGQPIHVYSSLSHVSGRRRRQFLPERARDRNWQISAPWSRIHWSFNTFMSERSTRKFGWLEAFKERETYFIGSFWSIGGKSKTLWASFVVLALFINDRMISLWAGLGTFCL